MYSRLEMTKKLSPWQSYKLYQRALSPVFKTVSPELLMLLGGQVETQMHDVFLWLAFHGNLNMARETSRVRTHTATALQS